MHTPTTVTISDAAIGNLRVKRLAASDDTPIVTFILGGTVAVAICSALAAWAIGNATMTPRRCIPYSLSDCAAAASEVLP